MDYLKLVVFTLVCGFIGGVVAGVAVHLLTPPQAPQVDRFGSANSTVVGNNKTTGNDWTFTSGLTVGTTTGRTTFEQIQAGTCQLIASSTAVLNLYAASTTLVQDCAITGIVPGDTIFAQFASTSAAAPGASSGWLITGASASSTSGYATISFVNNTGVQARLPASIASTTKYLLFR